jgi:hypothetical protein
MTPADTDLEARIANAALRLCTATTPKARREAWDTLRTLHGQRSEDQIRHMERERGLAA